MRQQVGSRVLAGLTDVDHVPSPLGTAFGAVAYVAIVGGFEVLRGPWQFARVLEADVGRQGMPLCSSLPSAPFVVILPESAERCDVWQGAQCLRGLSVLQGVKQREAIFANPLGIRRTLGLLLGQPAVFDAFASSFVPDEGGHALQPRRGDSRQFIEGCPQGLGHQFEAMQHTDGREHVGRVGALLASGFE
jgi:hypothetical protein